MKEYKILDFAGIDFPFWISKGRHTRPVAPHTHDFIELEIIIEGSAEHIVEGRAYSIKKGDVVVIMPSFVHELRNVHNLEHYNFKFDLEKLILLETDVENLSGFQSLFIYQPFYKFQHDYTSHMLLDQVQLSEVNVLCELILEEWTRRRDGYKWVIKSYFLALVAYLSRNFSVKDTDNPTQMEEIAKTVAFIHQNLDQKITLSMLSKMVCLSERQYTRIFKKAYGVSPIEYIINCRLTMACRVMKNTNKSLAEVSMICGFGDKVYFARTFKGRYHMTPGQYRKKLRSE